MKKSEILALVEQKIQSARDDYIRIKNTPERYRDLTELACAERRLITLECLGIDLGIIETGTI